MNKALYWWNYLINTHWVPTAGYFGYTPTVQIYETEAPYFLTIISELKYYCPTFGNWTYVLQDIGNRFLGQEWNSKQWLDCINNVTTYAEVHAWGPSPWGNDERRLCETVSAWQALLGIYLQMNSTYEADIIDMIQGNQNIQPA
jgi:hypothetical protein